MFKFLDHCTPHSADAFRAAWREVETIVAGERTPDSGAALQRVMRACSRDVFEARGFLAPDGTLVPLVGLPAGIRREMVRELLGAVPPDKARAFHLGELLGEIHRESYGEGWAAAEAVLDDQRLVIDGHQVMDAWETPIMHAMVDGCLELCTAKERPDVLEIGWGMGISGRRFLARDVDYTVVEAHPEVARLARDAIAANGGPHRVVESLWQSATLLPAAFDIVLFDAYFATAEPDRDYLVDVVRFVLPLLREGGVFTYFIGNHYEQVPALIAHGFSRVTTEVVTGFEVPADCTYERPGTDSWVNVFAIK